MRTGASQQEKILEVTIIFLVSPLFSLIRALRQYKNAWAKNVLWCFIIFYGYTFIISGQMDSVRYTQRLAYLSKQDVGSVGSFLQLIYQEDTGYVDVVEPLLTFLLSRVTNNGHVLMMIFALVFGYFYSRNVWFLLDKAGDKIKREAFPFLLMAAFIVAIWAINGFRFWTATHIFLFGLFRYADGKKLRGILCCAFSIFVHFSFALPVIALIIFIIVGNRSIVFFGLYFASFFVAEISPQALQAYSNSIPEVFQERTESYTNKEYIKGRAKSEVKVNWYVKGRITAIRYAINALLILLFLKHRSLIKSDKFLSSLLCYALLLASLANLLSGIPSTIRFQIVSSLIFFSFFFLFVQYSKRTVFPGFIRWPSVAAFLLYFIVEIRAGFDTMGLMTVLGNPIAVFFITSEVPLIDYIK